MLSLIPIRLVAFLLALLVPLAASARGRAEVRPTATTAAAQSASTAAALPVEQVQDILQDLAFVLDRSEGRQIASGRSLSVPRGARVTVYLDACVQFVGDAGEPPEGEALRLSIQTLEAYRRMSLPEIRIPVLHGGQSLRLSFSFQADVPLAQVRIYLFAQSVSGLSPVRLHVQRFSLHTEAAAGDLAFRLHYLQIEEGSAAEVAGSGESPVVPANVGPASAGSIAYRSNR